MSADYSFDGEKHAQTNGDMDEGGHGLTQSNDAAGSLNRAQIATRWTDEQGAQDFRNSAVRFFDSVDEMLADERAIFDTFQMNLTDAVREAVSSEESNASVLEQSIERFGRIPRSLLPPQLLERQVLLTPRRVRSPMMRLPQPAQCPSSEFLRTTHGFFADVRSPHDFCRSGGFQYAIAVMG